MSEEVEEKLYKIPILNVIVRLLKKLKFPGLEGLSLYDLFEMYIAGILKGAISTRASSIAFSLFMAIFPLLIFLVTLLPFVKEYMGMEDFDREFLAVLESFLPTATSDYFGNIYDQINQKRGGLLSSTFFLSIFLIANGVNAIFAGFENSYHVELTRHFVRQYLYALAVGLILALLIIFSAVGYIYFEINVVEYLSELLSKVIGYDIDAGDSLGVKITKFLFFMFLTYVVTAVLYYFGTAEGKNAKFFSPGALMTTILFIATSYLFGVYVEKFARYSELYGALAGLLILMVFIWLNSNILLLGFELNATLNRFKRKKIINTIINENEKQNKEN